MATLTAEVPLSTRLAHDLLHAWTSGDSEQLELELRRSMEVPLQAYDQGEEERRHLLCAVAARMKAHPDRSKRDPVTELCTRLLGHLVCAQ